MPSFSSCKGFLKVGHRELFQRLCDSLLDDVNTVEMVTFQGSLELWEQGELATHKNSHQGCIRAQAIPKLSSLSTQKMRQTGTCRDKFWSCSSAVTLWESFVHIRGVGWRPRIGQIIAYAAVGVAAKYRGMSPHRFRRMSGYGLRDVGHASRFSSAVAIATLPSKTKEYCRACPATVKGHIE